MCIHACKHASTILEAAMVLELQFGSLGTVFLVFWSSRGTLKSMPKSYLNASRPAPASRLASWPAGSDCMQTCIDHFGSCDGSGAPIRKPWDCIFGVLEFQMHCEKHA